MSKKSVPGFLIQNLSTIFQFLLTGIRLLIGWHFLYEGLSKLFNPGWSSAAYLLESHWLFSSLFHWIASNESILYIIDLINVWGLIIIGFGLFFGIFTRITSATGALLLLIYYIAQPPLVGFTGETTGEGHYLLVNKNLIEFFILLIFVFLPPRFYFGLDRWYARSFKKQDETEVKIAVNEIPGRREFLKDIAALPVFGVFLYSLMKKRQWESFEERNLITQPKNGRIDAATGASPGRINYKTLNDLKEPVSSGKIGSYNISRMICGGNLISGFAHSRDLIYVSSLIQSYFDDDKVIETMRLCEACGINTIILRVDEHTLRIMKKYRQRNGNMNWIAQVKVKDEDVRSDVDAAVDAGAMGTYIQGNIADKCAAMGNMDLLSRSIDYIRNKNVLSGIAGHDLNVIIGCEKSGLEPDFYMKTLNSGNYWTAGPRLVDDTNWKPDPEKIVEPEYNMPIKDNIWSVTPRQTVEYMKQVKRPWIAYKVLGAGAIHPKKGFKYAFENGADFVCVGMFDFQIVDNANIVNDILHKMNERTRPWLA